LAEDYDLDHDVRARVAWLYFMEGMTQDAVAQNLGLTRARVLRMLQTAREDGTVQIRVTAQLSQCVEMERRLEKRYKLERAVVIPTPQDDAKVGALVGAATGALLDGDFADGMTVGLGWGRTLSASLTHISPRTFSRMTVVSLLGGLTRAAQINPSEFAWRFADRLGAECYMLAAPVFAPDRHSHEALLKHSRISEVFARAQKLDLAIVSVGDLSPNSTMSNYDLLEREELTALMKAGAVGDVLCRFIDGYGNVLSHPINDLVISADPKMLHSARRIVLASGGWEKAPAVRSALLLLEPEVLVTDYAVAETLLV
jgi:DNA-binding transcriptional regulator LsrR (DeoR family)